MLFQNCDSIILASQSPRRQQLLQQIGVKFDLLPVDIDESVNINEKPQDYVVRLAKSKANAAWESEQVKTIPNFSGKAILTADTCVVSGEKILGKPRNMQHAKQMLAGLSGTTHQVITGVALKNRLGMNVKMSLTRVTFAKLTAQTIDSYCKLGEGVDKAGSYAIQGIAAQFISSIQGSYTGVVGLPLYETTLLLEEHFLGRP